MERDLMDTDQTIQAILDLAAGQGGLEPALPAALAGLDGDQVRAMHDGLRQFGDAGAAYRDALPPDVRAGLAAGVQHVTNALNSALAALERMRQALPQQEDKASRYGARRQKVPAFARFRGTSFYKKSRVRAREYEKHKAHARAADAYAAGHTHPATAGAASP